MSWINRLRGSFRKNELGKQLDAELQFHIEMRTQEFIAAGMDLASARHRARRLFGNQLLLKERTREMDTIGWIETLFQDMRYAIRILRKTPGFTCVAVTSVALGIAVNTTIFGAMNAVLLRSLPYSNSDRLVMVFNSPLKQRQARYGFSMADLVHWRREGSALEQIELARWGAEPNALTGAGTPERVGVEYVTPGLFSLLGVTPFMGRMPTEEASASPDTPNSYPGAALRFEFWQRHFGSDPRILGRGFFVDNAPATAVAVLPRGFDLFGGHPADVYLLWGADDSGVLAADRWLAAVGKLKPGLTIQQAQASLDIVARRLERAYPDTNKGLGVMLQPLQDALFGWSREVIYPLFAAVGFVLLIACTNIANLLLARASKRRKEMGIRTALGAARLRLIRQMLTESMLLALAGGILGLVLSVWGIRLFVMLSPRWFPQTNAINIDGRVLSFTLGISILAGIVFGLAPALRASKTDLNDDLKEGGRSAIGGARHRMRSALVVIEVALSLVLLVGAGLMINTLVRVLHTDPGFQSDHLMTLEIRLIGDRYFDISQANPSGLSRVTPQVGIFCRQLLEQIRRLPGVESAALTDWLPMLEEQERPTEGFSIAGRTPSRAGERTMALFSAVSPDFFRVMRIPLLKGRPITEQDVETAPWVVVINEAMAQAFWPNQDPIGQVITIHTPAAPGEERPREIVGVVGNVRQYELAREPGPEMYSALVQQPQHCSPGFTETRLHKSLVLRTAIESQTLTDSVRKVTAELAPDSPVFGVQTVRQMVASSTTLEKFYTQLLVAFGAAALLLAAVGIYGVTSYSVSERSHEIGLRLALGAQSGQVLRLVLREGLLWSLIGVAMGLTASFGATPLIANFLYGVKAHDPVTLVLVSLFLITITILATYIPAHRATRVDPMLTLRHE